MMNVKRNVLNDHSPKITTPTTARTAVKPTLTEVEKAPLLVVLEGTLDEVLVGVTDEVLDGAPDSEEDSGKSGVFVSLARCRKAAKVKLPVSGALIDMTIPSPQWLSDLFCLQYTQMGLVSLIMIAKPGSVLLIEVGTKSESNPANPVESINGSHGLPKVD